MDVRLLTDTIVRQTTVLFAQVATAAGVRAPLAHVANQVFLELAQELEGQGVRRKVVADMFGLALRSYELKMHRLLETSEVQRSAWRAVYVHLEQQSSTRLQLSRAFPSVSPRDLSALLNDLVDSGLAYRSGTGKGAVYGVTPEVDMLRREAAARLRQIASPFLLRRLKSDPAIIEDLPPKNEMKVVCTLTGEQGGGPWLGVRPRRSARR